MENKRAQPNKTQKTINETKMKEKERNKIKDERKNDTKEE